MARIEPFAQWINEEEDYSSLSMEELGRLRELGLLQGDDYDMYKLAVDKFLEDPQVEKAVATLRAKFSEYSEALFPYEEYESAWDSIRNEAEEQGIGSLGWFEYLMFG